MTDVANNNFLNTIMQGNCVELLKRLPDESVDCCITSITLILQKKRIADEMSLFFNGGKGFMKDWTGNSVLLQIVILVSAMRTILCQNKFLNEKKDGANEQN
jgi:DNA modification methylase